MIDSVTLVSVNVGGPQEIVRGQQVRWSSIGRRPVATSPPDPGQQILLTYNGLAGDQCTDTRIRGGEQVHGGPKQAVYAYPVEHYPEWQLQMDRETELPRPAFGENLTVAGITEHDVHIGDIWAWGSTLLEVSAPRRPCPVLEYWLDYPAIDAMKANGRCGWYLQVKSLRPHYAQLVPIYGQIRVVHHALDKPTVAEQFFAKYRT